MSEDDAVVLAKRGDESAFEVLYNLHHQRVLGQCRKHLRNSNDAEDVTQEIFLAVYRSLPNYEGRSSFTTWLHRVTMNAIVSYCRQKHIKCKVDMELPDTAVSPTQHTALEIKESLGKLTDMERFCVEARAEGHSVRNLGGIHYYKSAQRRLRGR